MTYLPKGLEDCMLARTQCTSSLAKDATNVVSWAWWPNQRHMFMFTEAR